MNDTEDDLVNSENPLSPEVESLLALGLTPIEPEAQQLARMLASTFDRIHRNTAFDQHYGIVRRAQGKWRNLHGNTRIKTLSRLAPHSCLVEIPAGAMLPRHRHHQNEECVVLEGSLVLGDIRVKPGSYHLAPPGTMHDGITAESDSLIYLGGTSIGSGVKILRDLVTAWLPSAKTNTLTIHIEEGLWTDLGERTQHKYLAENNGVKSLFVRMGLQTRLPENFSFDAHEVLVVQGEALFGDTLMQAGDYRFSPDFQSDFSSAIHHSPATYSETGALLFIRGKALNLPVPA